MFKLSHNIKAVTDTSPAIEVNATIAVCDHRVG